MIELKAKMWKNTPETGSNCEGALNKNEEAKKKKRTWSLHNGRVLYAVFAFVFIFITITYEQWQQWNKSAHGSNLAKKRSFSPKIESICIL